MDIKAMREKLASIHNEATKYANDFADKDETAEGKTAQDARFAEMDKITKSIEAAEKLAKYSFETKSEKVVTAAVTEAQKAFEKHEATEKVTAATADKVKFAQELNVWANYGVSRMDSQYATITTATQSNVYLPRSIAATVLPTSVNTFRDAINIQGMQDISLVTTPTTAAMKVPVITGVAGAKVAETASSETDGTNGLTESFDLNVATYMSGSVYYSNQVLEAGGVDINTILPTMQYEKELGLESDIVSTMKVDGNITQNVTMSGITSSGFTFAKFQAFNRLLPKRFDTKKVILLSDAAFSAAEALVDTNGRPILAQDTQNQELKRFLGTPVLRCSYLSAFGASAVVGMIISLIGFRLRDAANAVLAKYDQVPAKPNQVGFNLFGYHAFGYSPTAVGLLESASS